MEFIGWKIYVVNRLLTGREWPVERGSLGLGKNQFCNKHMSNVVLLNGWIDTYQVWNEYCSLNVWTQAHLSCKNHLEVGSLLTF